ncbi:MAG: hypothetical protein NTX62_05810 [Deltaproteobacteria bacterium]|jgi:hypothetical protein|nr:hypothetical protein [Deltaproteobacteria bacterium]
MYFSPIQMTMANGAFQHAEKLAGHYFRLTTDRMRLHRYDVKTLAYLEDHEVRDGAFAHLCKYHYKKEENKSDLGSFNFYRICLQDNRILDAIDRGHSFIKITPLMLYIAAHELVHIVRFETGEIEFDASLEEKEREEEKVHMITKDMLQSTMSPELKIVLDCFSSRYKIGDLFN